MIPTMTAQKSIIIGRDEYIELPEFSTGKVLAKVDTGAYSGAIHAEDIHLSDDKTHVLFRINGQDTVQSTEHFTERMVCSAFGEEQKRYIIETPMIIGGVRYITRIGLSDRSPMTYAALLGRRFLGENNFIVDVNRSQKECGDKEDGDDEDSNIE